MKTVLISIQPKWCEFIANGKKTVEVRKTKPKIETPFKCYIYCTLQGSNEFFKHTLNGNIAEWNKGNWGFKKGKVIGEFVCKKIDRIGKRGFANNFDYCYLSLNVFGNDDIEIEITDIKKSCIPKDELNSYGANSNVLYAWHISNLVIYDKPKELSEFYRSCGENPKCNECELLTADKDKYGNIYRCCGSEYEGMKPLYIDRPPQSWCYVEEVAV